MKKKLYAINDVKAEVLAPPFLAENDDIARRVCCESFADKNSIPHKYGRDFALVRLGEFDLKNGDILPERMSLVCFLDTLFEVEK